MQFLPNDGKTYNAGSSIVINLHKASSNSKTGMLPADHELSSESEEE